MTTQDPTNSSPGAPGTIVDVLMLLQRALDGRRLLGPDHPAVSRAIDDAAERSRALPADAPWLAVTPSGFADASSGSVGGRALAPLASRLHALGVAAIMLRPPPTRDAVAEFASLIDQAERAPERGAEIIASVGERTGQFASLAPIRYDALATREGAREAGADGVAPSRHAWDRLVSMLLSGPDDAGAVALADLAASAERSIALDPSSAGAIRESVSRALESSEVLEPEAQLDARHSLRRFVGVLTPDARAKLIAVNPGAKTRSLELLAEASAAIPAGEVLDAIKDLDLSNTVASHDALMIFRVLANAGARASPGVRAEVTARAEVLHDRASAVLESDSATRDAIQAMLRRKTDAQYTPTDYAAQIDRSVQRIIDPSTGAGLSLDPGLTLAHAGILAAHLAASPDPDTDSAGPIAFLRATAPELLAKGEWSAWLNGVDAAQRIAREGTHTPTKAEAGLLWSAATTQPLLGLTLKACRTMRDAHPILLGILLGAADAGPRAVAIELVDQGDCASGVWLRRWLAQCAPNSVSACAEAMLATDDAGARAGGVLLDGMTEADAATLVERLFQNTDATIRARAFTAMARRVPSTAAARLRDAFNDESSLVQEAAASWLSGRSEGWILPLLTRLAQAGAEGEFLGAASFERVVRALLERGPEGREAAAKTLRAGCWRLGRAAAQRGHVLATQLAPHLREACVKRALSAWSLSPARLLHVRALGIVPAEKGAAA